MRPRPLCVLALASIGNLIDCHHNQERKNVQILINSLVPYGPYLNMRCSHMPQAMCAVQCACCPNAMSARAFPCRPTSNLHESNPNECVSCLAASVRSQLARAPSPAQSCSIWTRDHASVYTPAWQQRAQINSMTTIGRMTMPVCTPPAWQQRAQS